MNKQGGFITEFLIDCGWVFILIFVSIGVFYFLIFWEEPNENIPEGYVINDSIVYTLNETVKECHLEQKTEEKTVTADFTKIQFISNSYIQNKFDKVYNLSAIKEMEIVSLNTFLFNPENYIRVIDESHNSTVNTQSIVFNNASVLSVISEGYDCIESCPYKNSVIGCRIGTCYDRLYKSCVNFDFSNLSSNYFGKIINNCPVNVKAEIYLNYTITKEVCET